MSVERGLMNTATMKRNLPTLYQLLHSRQKKRLQQLPKHLQPISLWPLRFQIFMNVVFIFTQITLLVKRDDFLTEVGPAIPMIISLLFLFYAVVSAFQARSSFHKGRGARLAKANFVLAVIFFLSWAGTVVIFLQ